MYSTLAFHSSRCLFSTVDVKVALDIWFLYSVFLISGIEVHNSLEDTFLPPPTAASLVGSPPVLGLDPDPESGTLSPGFRVQPRGHSAPVIISQVKNWKPPPSFSVFLNTNKLNSVIKVVEFLGASLWKSITLIIHSKEIMFSKLLVS